MIELPRSLARQFRAVVRQSLLPSHQRSTQTASVVIETNGNGLLLRAHLGDVVVAYQRPGTLAKELLMLPLDVLQELEARSDEKLTLEALGRGKVRARWYEGAVPRSRDFAIDGKPAPPVPEAPQHFTPLSAKLLQALDEARKTTSRDTARFALNRLQFRGSKGEVAASDGRQLLIQSGFAFPWQEDVLVPALAAFGSRELVQSESVRVGKTEEHVCIEAGRWTFFLRIDRDSRYPRVDDVIPRPNRTATLCRLHAENSAFLSKSLAGMVDRKDEDQRITLDLNGRLVVRARREDQEQPTEVVLECSTVTGPPVCFASNCRYLQRALELGLTELQVGKPDAPILAKRPGLRYVWMPLGKGDAGASHSDTHRISPPTQSTSRTVVSRRREVPKVRLHESTPTQIRPTPPLPVTVESKPAEGTPRMLGVLRTLFTPRGWLWRSHKPQ